MSLTNYTDLQASIASWMKRDDLATNIPDFITLLEVKLARKMIIMNPPPANEEATQTGNLSIVSSGPALLPLPVGYLGTKRFQLQIPGEYKTLTYKTPEQMGEYQVSGDPDYYTTNGNNLEIGAPPDSAYAYVWTYYQAFTPLATAPSGVNWVMTAHPDLYLFGSLVMAEPFMKNDKRIPVWASMFSDSMDDFELANRKNRQSGSTLQVRSDAAI